MGNRPGGEDFGQTLILPEAESTIMGSGSGLSYMMIVYGYNGTAPGVVEPDTLEVSKILQCFQVT